MRSKSSEFGSSSENRLGTGEIGTPQDFANAASERFLREIEASAQIVLKPSGNRLAGIRFSEAGSADRDGKVKGSQFWWRGFPSPNLRQRIHRWATQFHLLDGDKVPLWLLAQLHSTFHMWERFPVLMNGERLRWGGTYTGYWIVDKLPHEELKISFPVFAWNPRRGYESRRGIEESVIDTVQVILKERLDEIEKLAANHGLRTAPEHRQSEHFNWAVRYQVLGQRVTEVASSIDTANPKFQLVFYAST